MTPPAPPWNLSLYQTQDSSSLCLPAPSCCSLDAGYTDDQFIEAYRKNMDTEGKGSKQSVILYIQREMGMSYVQAKKLYEILNKSLPG